jgi:hypothetical protein
MDNIDQAKETMFAGIFEYLDQKKLVFANNPAFKQKVGQFITAYNSVKSLGAKNQVSASGYSDAKNATKKEMADKAAEISGYAFVKLQELNQEELSAQLHITTSDFYYNSDPLALALTKATYDLLENNLALITPEYVTVDDLHDLQALMDEFVKGMGKSDEEHRSQPVDTKAYKAAIKDTDKILDDMMLLARKFAKSQKEFYDKLVALNVLPPVAVRHTSLNITAIDSVTKKPIENVFGELSNSTKTDTSDTQGELNFDRVRASKNITLTLTAPNYQKFIMVIAIARGKENNMTVEMVKDENK